MLGVGPALMPFVVVFASVEEGGCYRLALISHSPFADVTLMKSCFQSLVIFKI